MPINLLSNANTILFHIIDYGSKWAYHVSPLWPEFLKSTGFLNDNQNKILLKKYSTIRAKLGYKEEGALHEWAYHVFPNGKYTALREILFTLKDKNLPSINKTVHEYAEEQLELCKQAINSFTHRLESTKYLKKLNEFAKICPQPQIGISTDAFIFPSPVNKSYQGGASGGAIFTEIPQDAGNSGFSIPFFVLLHEYFHRVNNISVLHDADTDKQFWTAEDPELHSPNFGVFGEIFTRTVVNYIMQGRDLKFAREELENYRSDEVPNKYQIVIISGIIEFYPVLEKFDSSEHTKIWNKLVGVYKKLVTEFTS